MPTTASEGTTHRQADAQHAARMADLLALQAMRAYLAASSLADVPVDGDDAVVAALLARVSRAVSEMEAA